MTVALPAYAPTPLIPLPAYPARPRPNTPTPLPATSYPGRRHLTRLTTLLVEALADRRPRRQLEPVMTYPAQTALRVLPRQPHNLRLRSVHLCQVDPSTVELAATLVAGGRAKALAARLEHTSHGWRFTAIHILGR